MKDAYLLWYGYYTILPKTHRHSLGHKVDAYLVDSIEFVATAEFLPRPEKLPFVRAAMRKVDTTKLLLMMLWETKSLDDSKYIALSLKIDAVGKMLGGWSGQLQKQNSPANAGRQAREK